MDAKLPSCQGMVTELRFQERILNDSRKAKDSACVRSRLGKEVLSEKSILDSRFRGKLGSYWIRRSSDRSTSRAVQSGACPSKLPDHDRGLSVARSEYATSGRACSRPARNVHRRGSGSVNDSRAISRFARPRCSDPCSIAATSTSKYHPFAAGSKLYLHLHSADISTASAAESKHHADVLGSEPVCSSSTANSYSKLGSDAVC